MSGEMINNDVAAQIRDLENRGTALAKRFRFVLPGCAALCAGTAVAYGVAHFMGPAASLTSIDVPPFVMQMFSDSKIVTGGGDYTSGVGGLEGATMVASSMKGVVVAMGAVAGTIMAIYGVIRGLSGGDYSMMLRGIVAAAFIGVSSMLFDFLAGGSSTTVDSSRDVFKTAVAQHDRKTIWSGLWDQHQTDTPAGLYILAQADVLNIQNQKVTPIILDAIAKPAGDYVPNAKVLYALETQVLGAPRSEVAIAYQQSSTLRKNRTEVAGYILALLSVLGLVAATTVFATRRIIANRLNRINAMLGL